MPTELAHELTGEGRTFDEVALEAQLEQARGTFDREVQRLRAIHDPGDLEEALARLPVYRTYVRDGEFAEADRAALAAAGRPDLFDGAPEEFVSRFQQTSPPVTAKGIEDTAFYRYVRLLALNDVGGDPVAGGSPSTTSTPGTSSGRGASRRTCSSRRRTTRSARATRGRASAR